MTRSISSRRLLAEYLQATRNEVVLDRLALRLAGLDPDTAPPLPRPSRWINLAKRFPLLFSWAAWALSVFWVVAGAAAFNGWKFVRRLSERRTAGQPSEPAKGYSLIFSPRTGSTIASAVEEPPRTWITFPWVDPYGARDETLLPADALLGPTDLFLVLRDACRATYVLTRRLGLRRAMQSYTAFDWFASRSALTRLDGPLLISAHFDRWAVLASFAIREIRLRTRVAHGLTLAQHGAVSTSLGSSATGVSDDGLALSQRIGRVTTLCTFDAPSEAVFKRSILTTKSAQTCNVRHFRPRLVLSDWPASGSKSRVLIVGHPICEAFHMQICKLVRDQTDLLLLYKPHPTAKMSSRAAACGWTLVRDLSLFPKVDLLLSYPSTLVFEYATHGVPAIEHPIDAPPETADQCVELLLERLREIHFFRPAADRSEAIA